MKIDKKLIESLKPCKDRFHNYLKYYGNQKLTKAQFMGRKNITQSDKMWVAFRLMPKENVRLAAADIAETVIHIYEARYPDDLRPRKAIEAAAIKTDARSAAYLMAAAYTAADAAYDATYADAAEAARAATYAAEAAACAATKSTLSAHAATYGAYAACAAACATACAAAYDATYADAAEAANEKLIRKIVLKYWR